MIFLPMGRRKSHFCLAEGRTARCSFWLAISGPDYHAYTIELLSLTLYFLAAFTNALRCHPPWLPPPLPYAAAPPSLAYRYATATLFPRFHGVAAAFYSHCCQNEFAVMLIFFREVESISGTLNFAILISAILYYHSRSYAGSVNFIKIYYSQKIVRYSWLMTI